MIAIVAALDAELSALGRRARVRRVPSPSWPIIGEGTLAGRRVLLVRTGMGAACARNATAVLMERHKPEAVLSIGFAGSVTGELRAGHLVIARRVYVLEEPIYEEPLAMSNGLVCDPALVELAVAAAEKRKLAFSQGAALTVPQVVGQPEVKGRIGDSLPVEMVEMESYWVGRVAADRGVPFLAVRVVLDEVGDRLPDLPNLIDGSGGVARRQALRQLLRRPQDVPGFVRMAARARRASGRLAVFAEALLDALAASDYVGRPQ